MKYLDDVRITSDKYEKYDLKKEDIVTILDSEIREKAFYVVLTINGCDVAEGSVKIKDLELVKSSDIDDDVILRDLPGKNPEWWCKVVDGYIVNLKGDRLNKVAYDYDS